jgi:hypothetical protein
MVLFLLAVAGCADMFQNLNDRGERFQDSMKERGVEFHDGKAVKVYRF